jgi:antitoxin (DNA-binding transcriptional repressor) of toxin-antitoxin stability system
MIITSNGRPIAILAAISESNLEESLKAFRHALVRWFHPVN